MPVRNAGTSTMVKCSPIAIRSGNPHNEDPWEWHCGFYPDSHPGEHRGEAAATFDEARADFEAAWKVFLAKRIEADLQAWWDQEEADEAGSRCPLRRGRCWAANVSLVCRAGHHLRVILGALYPFGTLKIAKRTFPLLIVSIRVPTKTRAPLTATSRYRPSVIRSARRAFFPSIVTEVPRFATGPRLRAFLAIEAL
jgi:hypothetical protein